MQFNVHVHGYSASLGSPDRFVRLTLTGDQFANWVSRRATYAGSRLVTFGPTWVGSPTHYQFSDTGLLSPVQHWEETDHTALADGFSLHLLIAMQGSRPAWSPLLPVWWHDAFKVASWVDGLEIQTTSDPYTGPLAGVDSSVQNAVALAAYRR